MIILQIVQKCSNLVELEKSCSFGIYMYLLVFNCNNWLCYNRERVLQSTSNEIRLKNLIVNYSPVGDITFRVGGALFSTLALAANATAVSAVHPVLAAHDITEMLQASSAEPLPLRVLRSYERSADGAALVLRFNVTSTRDVEIGAVGFALPAKRATITGSSPEHDELMNF